MCWILLFGFAVAVCVSTGSSDKMAFTRMVADSIAQRLPGAMVVVADTLSIEMQRQGQTAETMYLHRAFRECSRDSGWLTVFLDAMCNEDPFSIPDVEQFEGKVVPVVWDRVWAEAMSSKAEIVYEPINAELVIVYAVDDGLSTLYFDRSQFHSLDTELVLLREFAIHNLRRMLPEATVHEVDGAWALTVDGNYESSLLLLDEYWM